MKIVTAMGRDEGKATGMEAVEEAGALSNGDGEGEGEGEGEGDGDASAEGDGEGEADASTAGEGDGEADASTAGDGEGDGDAEVGESVDSPGVGLLAISSAGPPTTTLDASAPSAVCDCCDPGALALELKVSWPGLHAEIQANTGIPRARAMDRESNGRKRKESSMA